MRIAEAAPPAYTSTPQIITLFRLKNGSVQGGL